jgi:hypothetical protein
MGRHRRHSSEAECEEVCSENTLVYRAAAVAYRNLSDTHLTVEQLSTLLESPNGYLQQYETITKKTGCTKENASVFANAITAVVDAAAEIGDFPGTGPSGPAITGLSGFPLPNFLPANGYSIPSVMYDPALAAFFIINILIAQYEDFVFNGKIPLKSLGEIFSQAFRDIYTSLLTTMPTTGKVVDLTYVSAVAHYVNLQIGIKNPIPIISFTP